MSETEKRGKGRGRRLYKQNPQMNSPGLTRSNANIPNSQTADTKTRTPSPPSTSVPEFPEGQRCENPQETSQPFAEDPMEEIPPLLTGSDPEAYLHVRITEVIDPGNFYAMVSLREHLDNFDLMTRKLIEMCDAHDYTANAYPRRDDVIGVNTSLIENFGLEYKWVRGRVIRIRSEEVIEVLLLDFGSTHLVKLSQICTALSETHKRTHSLSRHCYITNCQPILQNWSRQACDFFDTLISQCSRLIRAAAFTGYLLKNTFIGLNLYGFDSKQRKWLSFGRELIQAGYAVTYKNPALTLYQPTVQPLTSNLISQGAYTQSYNSFYTTGYLPMNTPVLEYSTATQSSLSNPSINIMQHLNDNSADFQQQYMDALLNYRKVRSLESVTSYDEFVPRVHPLDRANGENGAAEVMEEVERPELDGNSEVENATALQTDLKILDNSVQFSPTQPPEPLFSEKVEAHPPHTQTQPVSSTPPNQSSPRSMGRGQMIRQNMERARLTESEKSSPSRTHDQLSLQIAQITVTPESSHGANSYTAEVPVIADSAEVDAGNTDNQDSTHAAPQQTESPKSGVGADNALEQDAAQDLEADSLTHSETTNETASHHSEADADTQIHYTEEFEESFGYSNGPPTSRHSRGRSRRSPVHWKRGSPGNRRHRPPLPTSKDSRTSPIPLASKYAKSITSHVHAKMAPSIQETEIAHMKLMLAVTLDQLLANFREETQKQFPDHLMKLMNDNLANKITTILGPTGPFSILLGCIFQRSIEHPAFIPLSFMVLSRLYSMYRQSMTETFTHMFISTQNALLAKLTSEETDATTYKQNYCQMISAYIEFILSKDVHPALMHLVEATILKFLLDFAGKGLELPVENVSNYQIKSECLHTILEKSGRVLLNLKTECFSEIKQTIDSNISQLQSMPLALYNCYTRCLQLLDEILEAGKEAPSGLTNLPPQVSLPPPQTHEHLQYPNQGYKQAAPVFQQDPRACLQQNISSQPHYVIQGYYPPQPAIQMPTVPGPAYIQQPYDAAVYPPQPLPPVSQQHMMPVNQTQQQPVQVPPQQFQQQPVLQSQPGPGDSLHSPNPPLQSIISFSSPDPFDQIRKMLTDLKEPDQIKKFEDARIQDDLLTADWNDLESVLKDSQIPRGLILRIKRYLNQNSQFASTSQYPQQFKHPATYTVQELKPPGYPMVPPVYQHPEHPNVAPYQQQVVDPNYVYPVTQMAQPQPQPQMLNPNTNTNNNNPQYPYNSTSQQSRFIFPTQIPAQPLPESISMVHPSNSAFKLPQAP